MTGAAGATTAAAFVLGSEAQQPAGPAPFLPPNGFGSSTWLSTTDVAASAVEIGRAPPASVYQSVVLDEAKYYSFSFWSAARSTSGGAPTGTDKRTVSVSVFDESWKPVTSQTFDVPSSWGERHRLDFHSEGQGVYHLALSLGSQAGASVAVANLQLETASTSGEPRAFQETRQSRTVTTGCDVLSAHDFRRRFDRECGEAGCYHVLRDPLIIDTEAMNTGRGRLVGKIAKGNYNYRIADLALNVVGTGVIDCQGASSGCYANAYVEYDLQHIAWNVPIEDYGGTARCFDFGVGNIASGKGLATERVLSMPLSSADLGLISQGGFLKREYAGRPLSGNYRLRIKESPTLVWANVEDIQVLVDYRYWSRVATAKK